MEKVNIAEILKDCPKGMELYSPLCGKCVFDRLNFGTIICKKQNTQEITFTSKGYYMLPVFDDCECMIFPSKDQRDWSKFQRPFKDGDILISELNSCEGNPFIFKQINSFGNAECYCAIDCYEELIFNSDNWTNIKGCRLATEEERQKMFDAIKTNGYVWNAENKTLKKLSEPKFKKGDIIQDKDGYKVRITNVSIDDECYVYESLTVNGIEGISFNRQDDWELVPNKFDITTLVPFESRVLIRDNDLQKWSPAEWGYYDSDSRYCPYKLVGNAARYCIPYEGNEHLLGTTDDCDEYYKTWEK